jgi:hypothetical protein
MCATLRLLADQAYRHKFFTMWGHLTDALKMIEPCLFCQRAPCACDQAWQDEKDGEPR